MPGKPTTPARKRAKPKPFSNENSDAGIAAQLDRANAEIERLRAERDKFERAWNVVSTRYEAILDQLGATDA